MPKVTRGFAEKFQLLFSSLFCGLVEKTVISCILLLKEVEKNVSINWIIYILKEADRSMNIKRNLPALLAAVVVLSALLLAGCQDASVDSPFSPGVPEATQTPDT